MAGLLLFAPHAFADTTHKIRVLVGDSPITNFQIRQRTNLFLMSSNELNKRLKAKLKSKSTLNRWREIVLKERPESKEEAKRLQKKFVARLQRETRAGLASGVYKKVLNELIDERLKINTAKRENIIVSPSMIEGQINQIAKRNSKGASIKTAKKAFFSMLASRGVGKATFRDRVKAQIAWQTLVRQKFGRELNFGDRDIEKQLGADGLSQQDKKIQFGLQQIVISIPSQKDQSQVVKKYLEADAIRKRFNGCANMKSLVAPYKNAKVINVGKKTLDQIPSPMNLILSDMKVGQITPPQSTNSGLEMYVVCERKQVTIDDNQRARILGAMRQKAFNLRAERYLKDIREEAHIEYRD